MIKLAWDESYYLRTDTTDAFVSRVIQIGSLRVQWDEEIDFGEPIGVVAVKDLLDARSMIHLRPPDRYPGDTSLPLEEDILNVQLAALVFIASHNPYTLNPYFPLTKTLDKAGFKTFYQLIQDIIRNKNFGLRTYAISSPQKDLQDLYRRGETRTTPFQWYEEGFSDRNRHFIDFTRLAPAHIVYLVAGHLAEIFFYRRDILERLLSSPHSFFLYTSALAFTHDGGQAGGNYDSARGAIQLVLSRLYEGFYGKTPGVAPFLHEFGHMLDHLDASTGKLGKSHGLLPGMRPEDGDIYTPEAREAFLKGKRIELERYLKLHEQGYSEGDPLPIGHPYVFQNDTEFIAGYLEMFFRNPHTFAAQNPDLYDGFSKLFKQDPRLAWDEDFPFYVEQNRSFYLSGARPPKPGITVA